MMRVIIPIIMTIRIITMVIKRTSIIIMVSSGFMKDCWETTKTIKEEK